MSQPHPLIDLAGADWSFVDNAPDSALQCSRGGFAWWYADACNDAGDGLVIINALGLPFLPNYLSSIRRGQFVRPIDRICSNVALYRRGKPIFYVLNEANAADIQQKSWQEHGTRYEELSIGGVRWISQYKDGRMHSQIDIDITIPSKQQRLQGQVLLDGIAPESPALSEHTSTAFGELPAHRWGLRSVDSQVKAVFDVTTKKTLTTSFFTFAGRGYHDSNAGNQPFDQLGIRRWFWGRLPIVASSVSSHSQRSVSEVIFYIFENPQNTKNTKNAWQAMLIEVDTAGQMHVDATVDVEIDEKTPLFYAPRWQSLKIYRRAVSQKPILQATWQHTVDNGPFYARGMWRGSFYDADTGNIYESTGMTESIIPERIDVDWQRFLVNMRVQKYPVADSIFLPLFAGSQENLVALCKKICLAPFSRIFAKNKKYRGKLQPHRLGTT